MSGPVKQEAPESRAHLIKWDGADWERIVEAAITLSLREHLDLNPTDIIRKGTRQLVEDILSQSTLKAS